MRVSLISLAGARHAMADAIDLHVADLEHWRLALPLGAVAQGSPQARHQLANPERLVDEVVGAEVERLDLLRLALARRQHDDGNIGPLPHLADHVLAVGVGQAEVEHDDLRPVTSDALHRLRCRGRRRDFEAVRLQRGLQEAQDRRLVVDDKDALLARHLAPLRAETRKRAACRGPFATGLSAETEPPCASMMPLAIASPRPVPSPPSARSVSAACAPGRTSRRCAAASSFGNTRPVVSHAQTDGLPRRPRRR